jgi:hypothetical protein
MPMMSKAKTPEALIAEQTPETAALMRKMRAWVKKEQPQLKEAIKWGGIAWVGKGTVCYAHPLDDRVAFGFFRGTSLKDPERVLRGDGKYVRSVMVAKWADMRPKALAALLRQAVRIDD